MIGKLMIYSFGEVKNVDYQTFPDCTTPSHEGGSLSVPNLAIFKVDALVDHRHLAHAIHPITFEAFGKPNRDQCTASVCGNLDDLTRIRLAVVLLTLETETNLDASELGHLLFSWVTSHIDIIQIEL
jgi:hypothetical protein